KGLTAWPDRPRNLYCGALTPDGKTLVTGSWDGVVTVWDAAAGRARTSFSVRAGPQAIAVSPDGPRFATASGRGVRLRDAEAGARLGRGDGAVPRRPARTHRGAYRPRLLARRQDPGLGGRQPLPGRRTETVGPGDGHAAGAGGAVQAEAVGGGLRPGRPARGG